MEVVILNEAGYKEAMRGLSFNKNQKPEDMPEVAKKLANKDGGHNKFLESIYVWIEVTAPRYWWQEADTYRLSTKQSESTMHTIMKRLLTRLDFAGPISESQLHFCNEFIKSYHSEGGDKRDQLRALKACLPEGFIQKRLWCMNYKTLRNIILQRRTHRLEEWRIFVREVIQQARNPELLPTLEVKHG